MAALGFRTMDEMIGRVDRLNFRAARRSLEGAGARFLGDPVRARRRRPARRAARRRDRITGSDEALDNELIARRPTRSSTARPVSLRLPIRNVHRTVGTMLGYEVTRRYGAEGLPDDTIQLQFTGSAGQSFGAFVPRGITLRARRRCERLRRQGPVGRQDHRLSAEAGDVRARREHHHRQRGALRRDQRRGLHPRRGGRAVRGAQQRRARGRRRRRRSRLRIHDGRPRRRARQDRAQLRGGHERRHRVRARRGRRLPRALQSGDGRSRSRSTIATRTPSSCCRT